MDFIMIHKYLEVKTGYRTLKVLPFNKIPSLWDCCPPSWIRHIDRAVNWKGKLGTIISVVLETRWPIGSMIWYQAWLQNRKMADGEVFIWPWFESIFRFFHRFYHGKFNYRRWKIGKGTAANSNVVQIMYIFVFIGENKWLSWNC